MTITYAQTLVLSLDRPDGRYPVWRCDNNAFEHSTGRSDGGVTFFNPLPQDKMEQGCFRSDPHSHVSCLRLSFVQVSESVRVREQPKGCTHLSAQTDRLAREFREGNYKIKDGYK